MKFMLHYWFYLFFACLIRALPVSNDNGLVIRHALGLNEKIIFFCDNYFSVRLESQMGQARASISFRAGQIYVNHHGVSAWCSGKSHAYRRGVWQNRQNIASIWYENNSLLFKMNNFSGKHANNCGGSIVPPSISTFKINNLTDSSDYVKYVLACTRQ